MPYRGKVTVCSEIHTKHEYIVGQYVEYWNVITGGTHSNHQASKGVLYI
jgi:hypothetical protein